MLENALRTCLYSKENNVPLKFLKNIDGVLVDMTKIINTDIGRFVKTYKYSIEDSIMLYIHQNKTQNFDKLSETITEFLEYINEPSLSYSYTPDLIEENMEKIDNRWSSMMENTDKRIEKLTKIKDFFDGIEMKTSLKESLDNSFSENKISKVFEADYKKFELNDDNAKFVFDDIRTDKNLFYVEHIDKNLKRTIKIHEYLEKDFVEETQEMENVIYMKYLIDGTVIDIKLNIEKSLLYYTYSVSNKDDEIREIVINIMKDFNLKNEKTTFISGSFNIDIKNYNEFSFYFFIMIMINLVNSDAANIIFTKESSNPRFVKRRSKYYFRDLERLNSLDYTLSFTVDNIISNLYSIKYRAKNKDKNYVLETAYMIKKYMLFYEDNSITEDRELVSDIFRTEFYEGEIFDYTDKSYTKIPNKISNLKAKSQGEVFPGSGEYTKDMCECKLQPIIIDKEDVEDWEEYRDFNSNNMKIKHNSMLFPPENSSQQGKKYYVCPSNKYPFPVLKPNNGENSTEYPYLPCCRTNPSKQFYDTYEETRLLRKGPTVSLKQSELQNKEMSINLASFFKNITDDKLEILPVKTTVNNSFLGCLLEATKGYTPPKRINDMNSEENIKILENYKETYEKNINELRHDLDTFGILPFVAKQEMFDYDNSEIMRILKEDEYIDTRMFYRFLEELFCVNIFVFTDNGDEPVMEKPRYRDFYVRNIKEELPCVFLYRDYFSTEGRVSLISGSQKLYSSKEIQKLFDPYYRVDIENNQTIVRKNPYRGIIWEKIFKNYKILSQKIDEFGKCYRLDVKFENNIISVYIPPSQPLNVDISSEIFITTNNLATKYFMEGEQGSRGLWYKINRMKEIFIPCKDVIPSDDKCVNFLKDLNKNVENTDYIEYTINSKNAEIFIELCLWLWRISSKDLNTWIRTYTINGNDTSNIFKKYKLNVSSLLPSSNSVTECIEWLRTNNQEFSDVFKNGKLYLYPQLLRNIYLYMKRIEESTQGLERNNVNYISSSIVSLNDYKNEKDELIFDDKKQFMLWFEEKFHNLELKTSLEEDGVYIYQSDKGMYLIKTFDSINKAMLASVFWAKKRDLLMEEMMTPLLLSTVITKYGYTIYDTSLKEVQVKRSNGMLDVIKQGTNKYSTFLKFL